MSENNKHTAELLRRETWQLTRCEDGVLMVHTDGDIVCCPDPNHEPSDFADGVRFALIAAAPDMRAALKSIRSKLDPVTCEAECAEIDAALAKAEAPEIEGGSK